MAFGSEVAPMFDGFETKDVAVGEISIHARIGGEGPPVLLLHGYPQTHAMWHRIAPELARRHRVVCADLRGYGASGKPKSEASHGAHAKRAMAADMVGLMAALGHERFALVGHDRGARVAHRLCLDHALRVTRCALLDIVPTTSVFAATDQALASGYFHWFFLSQPSPLPERMIGADPHFWLEAMLARWSGRKDLGWVGAEALAAYRTAFADPAVIEASCEDYRAGATIDLSHDADDAERRIACPVLVLWGRQGLVDRFDPLAVWRAKASGPVTGQALDCGHFLPEERAEETASLLSAFLGP